MGGRYQADEATVADRRDLHAPPRKALERLGVRYERRLFLSLIDEPTRTRHGLERYRHYQCESATLRINVALLGTFVFHAVSRA